MKFAPITKLVQNLNMSIAENEVYVIIISIGQKTVKAGKVEVANKTLDVVNDVASTK